MKNKGIVFFMFMIIFCMNVFGEKGFVNEADFYFASQARSLYDINGENVTKLRRVFDSYKEFKGINFDILMRTYPYKLIVRDKVEDDFDFLMQFDISGGNLPEFITRNLNFYWDKMYKNTNVAFDLKSNFVFAFDDKKLVIAKGINLFFENEQLTYMENPEYLENSSAYRNMFSEEEFSSVFYDIKNETACFFLEKGEKIKSLMAEVVEDSEENANAKELMYFEDSKRLVYSLDFEAFNMFMNSILPNFGKAEFEALAQAEHPYFVYGDEYAYVVFDVLDMEGGKNSLIDAIKSHLFYRDQSLEISDKTQDIFYVELPLIYKKIYFMYLNDANGAFKIVVSDKEDILRYMADRNLLINIYEAEENKNTTIDFEKGLKIFEYNEKGYSIKETERM